MNTIIAHKLVEKAYGLLDVCYFRNQDKNPRLQVAAYLKKYLKDDQSKILEICCGTGTAAIEVAKVFPQKRVVGIDISRKSLEYAKEVARRKQLANIQFRVMDAMSTSFEDNSFDVVIISLVLHELSEKYAKKIITEAKRVVSSKGMIIVVEWELPKKALHKILYFPIQTLEARGFEKFLKQDLTEYFLHYDLRVVRHLHGSYTQIFILKEETS